MIKILYPKPGDVSRMGGKQLMEIQADTEAEIMALHARVDDGVQTFVAAPGSVAHTPDHSADWEFSPAGTWVKRGGGTPYERVILPETVLKGLEDETHDGVSENYALPGPWTHDPYAGAVWIINYNGTDYECEAMDFSSLNPDMPADAIFVFGNTSPFAGGTTPVINTDIPFFLMAITNEFRELDGEYGAVYPLPSNSMPSVTLSIREKVKAKVSSDGGGTWVLECVGFKITNNTEPGLIIGSGQASHTFEETMKSINNGRIPVLKAQMEGQGMLFLPLLTVTDEAIIFGMSMHGMQSTGYVQPDGLLQITLNEPT